MREKKNVIVVMLDTLQFNYLGCYGNTRVKTPNIDRFATEGVVFENAYTEGLPTVPCRRAMLTGRYTLPVKGWSQLDVSDTTIADLCWGQPIDSYLIHDSGPFRLPKFGYSRGFDKVFFLHGHETDHQYYAQDELGGGLKAEDYYEDHVMEKADEILGENVMRPLMNQVECHLKERQYWKSDGDQHAAQIMKEAVRNLERVDRNKSFFMWIDCFDPHEPWDAPSVYDPDLKCPYDPDYEGKDMFLPIQGHVDGLYTDRELEHIRALYAEKVTMVDKWFGHLMNNIRTLGMEDDTLVILVSDHGSPMGKGEHGRGGLGNTVLPVGIPLSGLSKIPTSRFPECPSGKPLFHRFPQPAKEPVMSEATLLDSVTFDEWIKSHDGIVLFHKKLCPHCKVMRTVLGKATAERPDIQLASVDSEEQPDLMARCSVERVPTLIVCRNGAVAARKSGIMNPRELLAFYESAS